MRRRAPLRWKICWLDLRILGIVSRPDEFPLPDTDLPNTNGASWNDWTVFQAASSLRSENGFLSYPRQAEPSRTGIALFDLRMSKLGLSSMGTLMVATMKLNEIPAADLRPIYEALCRVPERQTEDPDAQR